MDDGGPRLAVQTLVGDDELLASGRKQGHGDLGRVPVSVLAPAPPWRACDRRRPVVALLDTGVDAHPWLAGPAGDPVVLDAQERGWAPPRLAVGNKYRGHATFLAGLVRQAAPDCRLLSVPVMGNDGLVRPADSLRALAWLAGEAESGDPRRYPDVLCMAYGYQPGPRDTAHTKQLRDALWRLGGLGVLTVASAGNLGADALTYPAAFAGDPAPPPVPVISVGATNPDGSYAHYSNFGRWVTHKSVGTGVISTMPDFNGRRRPPAQQAYPDSIGSTVDPDNFASGFARWSGTSFAAATLAGRLARALAEDPAPNGDRIARARRSLAAISSLRA
ncbi:MAG TPA: S8/S53 family peptidase [Streptosporangiaceae bacterium]|jgi:hypothetical protein